MEPTTSAHLVTCLYFIHLPYLRMHYENKQTKLTGLEVQFVLAILFVQLSENCMARGTL